jgi:hypothetical protein
MKFIFCFYDLNYTPEFLKSWVNLSTILNKNKIPYNISTGDSCNAFYAKQKALKGNVLHGSNQKPFQGQYNYEYIVFLSGNILYLDFDMVIIKYGVIEKLTYPWFRPWNPQNKQEQAFTDIDFCKRIQKEANVNLLIDPGVNVKRKDIVYV